MTYYSSYYVLSPYDLEHHGILGMKWGVRRYQNKDGTLTPEGKRRYGSSENFEAARSARRERLKTAGKVALGVAGAAATAGAGYLINRYAGAQIASLAGPAIQAGRKVVGDLGSKLSNVAVKALNIRDGDVRTIDPESIQDFKLTVGSDGKIGYRQMTPLEKASKTIGDRFETSSSKNSLSDRVSKALNVRDGETRTINPTPMFEDPRSEKQQLQDRLREIERIEEYRNRKK